MDVVLTSSEVDLVLPHSSECLYEGYDGLCARLECSGSWVTTFFRVFILGK
jgi:hypothetical protein